jgi:hypothetical protein
MVATMPMTMRYGAGESISARAGGGGEGGKFYFVQAAAEYIRVEALED